MGVGSGVHRVESGECVETGWVAAGCVGLDRSLGRFGAGRPCSVHQAALSTSPACGGFSTQTSRFSGDGKGWLSQSADTLTLTRSEERGSTCPPFNLVQATSLSKMEKLF